MRRKRVEKDFAFSFRVFFLIFVLCFFVGSVLTGSHLGVRPILGAATLGCLHIAVSGVHLPSLHRCVLQPTNSFQSSIPYQLPYGVFIWGSLHSIRTRWFTADTILFLSWASLIISWIKKFYIYLRFPQSPVCTCESPHWKRECPGKYIKLHTVVRLHL